MSVDRLVLVLEVRCRELTEINDLRHEIAELKLNNDNLSRLLGYCRDDRDFWARKHEDQLRATHSWRESADVWRRQYEDATRDLQEALGKLEAINAAIGAIVNPSDLNADVSQYHYNDSPEDYPDYNDDIPF